MADTQIRFTVEGMQTIESALDSVIRKADELTDAWMLGGKIVIDDLQDQIRLLEERNRLARANLGQGFSRNLSTVNEIIERQIRLLRTRNDVARAGFRNEVSEERRRAVLEEVAQENPETLSVNRSRDSENNRDFLEEFREIILNAIDSVRNRETGGYSSIMNQDLSPVTMNDDIERVESLTGIADSLDVLLTDGIRISSDSLEDFASVIAEKLQGVTINARGRGVGSLGAVTGSEAQRTSGSQDNRREAGISDFIRAFSFSNLIRGMDYGRPSSIPGQAIDNTASALGMLGGKAGIIGLIISAVKGIVTASADAKEQVVPYAQEYARLSGRDFADLVPVNVQAEAMARGWGVTRQEQLSVQSTLARAMGSSQPNGRAEDYLDLTERVNDTRYFQTNSTERRRLGELSAASEEFDRSAGSFYPAEVMIALEKLYGVSQQTTAQIARAARGNEDFRLMDTFALQGQLREELGDDRARVMMSEYADILAQAITRQMSITGEGSTDIRGLSALITSLAGVRGMTPELTNRFIQGSQQSFMNPSSPQEEALQNAIFRQIAPEASFYDLLEMRESIASGEDPQTFLRYLQALRERSYNEEDFAYNISQFAFGGGNYRISRQIAEDISANRLTPEGLQERYEEARGVAREEAQRARDNQDRVVAESERTEVANQEVLLGTERYEQTLAKFEGEFAEAVNGFGSAIDRFVDGIGNAIGNLFNASKNISDAATTMKDNASRNFQ